MGVPKFYRWISERYPCLSEIVREYQIPEFDNLYLDMNGIIHLCSHPNDNDPHFRITEEKIFADIFHYIECLFRLIKPRKVFFMAVDGVAPRAKMNQQRGRRFRTAREAQEAEKKAILKGETLPSEERFDSNCITPGTEFMVKLQEQLKYFVSMKVSTDRSWQGPRIYLSGHETPGEGEHKIMDFIRSEKSKRDYDPNTRHCLYGLDADLIMLGICTHEPHFSLLREEVRFTGKKTQKRIPTPEETTFHLLHLSLLREYLEHEFSPVKSKLTFEFDVEKIVDDWVLMGFLVGNDFIPNLPNLHIVHGALPALYKTYVDVLPTLDGYINEGGNLNLVRFEKYLKKLAELDYEHFNENYTDFKWLEAKKATSEEENGGRAFVGKRLKKRKESERKKLATANAFEVLNTIGDDDFQQSSNEILIMDKIPVDDLMPSEKLIEFSEDDDEYVDMDDDGRTEDEDEAEDQEKEKEDDMFEMEFQQHKRDYYVSKMDYEQVTSEVLRDQAECFVRAIQWNLHYYYDGVCSWSWFYPHHYAPYVSDVKNFARMDLQFDIGTPFLPFEQLLAVLPSASRKLLPTPLQDLMCNEDSALIDYYPPDFETDLNGKQQDWEAVVLIPFINEKRLLAAMHPLYDQLTADERRRNSHGPCLLYTYSEEPLQSVQSSLPGKFPDIKENHAKCTLIPLQEFVIERSKLCKGLCNDVRLDVYFPGFPTLKHLPHKAALKKAEVKVFQMNSRGDNMILELTKRMDSGLLKTAEDVLGKVVFVGWPHLTEALVTCVSHEKMRCVLKQQDGSKSATPRFKQEELNESDSKTWQMQRDSIKSRYFQRWGVEIGDTQTLVLAKPLIGRKYLCTRGGKVTLEKQWATMQIPYALQAIVKDIEVHDASFQQFRTLADLFPPKSIVFILGSSHYGLMGEVVNSECEQKAFVAVKLGAYEEPDLESVIGRQSDVLDEYLPSYVVAQRLGITHHLLSRITGSYYISMGSRERPSNQSRANVGLNLKFSKKNTEMPGYTKKINDVWMFSPKAVDCIREYMEKFTDLFEILSTNVRKDNIYQEEIADYCEGENILKDVEKYLKTLPSHQLSQQLCGGDTLDETIVKAIEEEVDKLEQKDDGESMVVEVMAQHLYKPTTARGGVLPDPGVTYNVFDRVVNVRDGFTVPLGLRGTVVGIKMADTDADVIYDVLFDKQFHGAFSLRDSSNRGYRMPPYALINLSHGQRLQQPNHKPTAVVHPQTAVFYAVGLAQSPTKGSPRKATMTMAPIASLKMGKPPMGPAAMVPLLQNRSNVDPDRVQYPNTLNHSPNSPFMPREISRPHFVTPRLPTSSGHQLVPRQALQNNQQPFQGGHALVQESDFKNIWEHLKAAKTGGFSPLPLKQQQQQPKSLLESSPSLAQAAKTLPKHGSKNTAACGSKISDAAHTRRGPPPMPAFALKADATEFTSLLKAVELQKATKKDKRERKAQVNDDLINLMGNLKLEEGKTLLDKSESFSNQALHQGQKLTVDQLFNETREHELRLKEAGKKVDSQKEPSPPPSPSPPPPPQIRSHLVTENKDIGAECSNYVEALIKLTCERFNNMALFQYIETTDGVVGIVQLPDGRNFYSDAATDEFRAFEAAAKVAYHFLKMQMQGPPVASTLTPAVAYHQRSLLGAPPQKPQLMPPQHQWQMPMMGGGGGGGSVRLQPNQHIYNHQKAYQQQRMGAPYFYQHPNCYAALAPQQQQPQPIFPPPAYVADPWQAWSSSQSTQAACTSNAMSVSQPFIDHRPIRSDYPFVPLQVTKHNMVPRKTPGIDLTAPLQTEAMVARESTDVIISSPGHPLPPVLNAQPWKAREETAAPLPAAPLPAVPSSIVQTKILQSGRASSGRKKSRLAINFTGVS